MSKLKQSREADINGEVRATLSKYMELYGHMNKKKLANLLNCSYTAIYSRWNDPGKFRVAELRAVYDHLHVPEEERAGLGSCTGATIEIGQKKDRNGGLRCL